MKNKKQEASKLALDANPFAKPKLKKLELLKGISKVFANLSIKNYTSIPSDIIDTIFESFKLETSPGQAGWQLIHRSLFDSLVSLIAESNHHLERNDIDVSVLDAQLNELFEKKDYSIGIDFFKKPQKIDLLDDIKPILKKYLGYFDFQEHEIANILIRLDGYFVLSLRKEWGRNPEFYSTLSSIITTPFDAAVVKEIEWNNYFVDIEREILKPIFSESFSLQQVYIPLRACYKQRKAKTRNEDFEIAKDRDEKDKEPKIVIDAKECLCEWIDKADKTDSIRIIHGGPGSGKSSFLKIFAANLAKKKQKVLFIPLHRFDIEGKLDDAVKAFLRYDNYFSHDVINDADDKLILLFDGLDELSMQGKALTEVAQSFLREVEKCVNNFNNRNLKLQVIISGRDVIVQQNEKDFRNEGQLLRLLPYYLTEDEKVKFVDKANLLNVDQREEWWEKYGIINGKKYNGLPEELKTDEIDEITAQPLLNFLVALTYKLGHLDFSKKPNLNEIYSELLNDVYTRGYSGGKHRTVSKMENEQFCVIMEEIALSAWHGKERTTTVAEINKHFESSGLEQLLQLFISDAEQGVISLLAAFYFRQAGHNIEGSQTFEFTHKSFGEYLTAKRIVRQLEQIREDIEANEKDIYRQKGKNIKQCLVEWIKIFGIKNLDNDLIKFICNELRLTEKKGNGKLEKEQKTIIKLLEYMLVNGMPLEELRLNTYKESNEQAINSERALLVIHSLISSITDIVSDVQWPNHSSFGTLLNRLTVQRAGPISFILRYINHLNLKYTILYYKDLYRANFRCSDLSHSYLYYAILRGAILENANLRGAILENANLKGVILKGAILKGAILRGAILENANLENANLRGAILKGAILDGAILEGANLEGAILENANLKNANLRGATLKGAILKGANLENANLRGAILDGANLDGANLDGAI